MQTSEAITAFVVIAVCVAAALHVCGVIIRRLSQTSLLDLSVPALGLAGWRLCKLLLSLILLVLLGAILFSGNTSERWLAKLGATAFLLALVALLWVPWDRVRLPLWLQPVSCSVATLLLGAMTYSALAGDMLLPRECSGRRRWFCDLLNTVHDAGGKSAVAAVFAALAALALVATIRSSRHVLREDRD